MFQFRKSINHHHDPILASLRSRKTKHKIKGDILMELEAPVMVYKDLYFKLNPLQYDMFNIV